MGLSSWSPDGRIGKFFGVIGAHVPPPEGSEPPPLWGHREYLGSLFASEGFEFEFFDEVIVFDFPSAAAAVDFYSRKFGPLVMARERLSSEGRWEALEGDLISHFSEEADESGEVRAGVST